MFTHQNQKILYLRRPSGKSFKVLLTQQTVFLRSFSQFTDYCASIVQRLFKVYRQNQINIFNGEIIVPRVFQLIKQTIFHPFRNEIIIHVLDNLKIRRQTTKIVLFDAQTNNRKQLLFRSQEKVLDILRKYMPQENFNDQYFLAYAGKILNFENTIQQQLIQDGSRVNIIYSKVHQVMKEPGLVSKYLQMSENPVYQCLQQQRNTKHNSTSQCQGQTKCVRKSSRSIDYLSQLQDQTQQLPFKQKEINDANSQINIDIGHWLISERPNQINNVITSQVSMKSDLNQNFIPISPRSPKISTNSKLNQIKHSKNEMFIPQERDQLFFTQKKFKDQHYLQETQKKIQITGRGVKQIFNQQRRKARGNSNFLIEQKKAKLKISSKSKRLGIQKCQSQVISFYTQGDGEMDESKIIQQQDRKFTNFIYKYDPFALHDQQYES